jgi:hypothetical protein
MLGVAIPPGLRCAGLRHLAGAAICRPKAAVFRPRIFLELLSLAFQRFVLHDGWAIASHIALSALTSLFPFLILLTALAPIFGTEPIADEAANLILEAWPKEVAGPIAGEVRTVLVRADAMSSPSGRSWRSTFRPRASRACGSG